MSTNSVPEIVVDAVVDLVHERMNLGTVVFPRYGWRNDFARDSAKMRSILYQFCPCFRSY
jgi:hypothetical protein